MNLTLLRLGCFFACGRETKLNRHHDKVENPKVSHVGRTGNSSEQEKEQRLPYQPTWTLARGALWRSRAGVQKTQTLWGDQSWRCDRPSDCASLGWTFEAVCVEHIHKHVETCWNTETPLALNWWLVHLAVQPQLIFNIAKDESETWHLSNSQKKLLYGVPNRIAVGGRPDTEVSEDQKGA